METKSPHSTTPPPNINWYFQLGREPLISVAELAAVFSLQSIEWQIINQIGQDLIISSPNELKADQLIRRLGGTIKISKQIDTDRENLAHYLNSYIPEGKIVFSLNNQDKKIGLEIKKQLKTLGRSVRYVEPKNTATILHNKLVEKGADITINSQGIFLTMGIQPFVEIGERDFGRPGRDDLSGMLPPKLAMIMVNLASVPSEAKMLDPFCGSGTVITEAMLMGYKNLLASDSSPKAIEDTQTNITWTDPNNKNVKVWQSKVEDLANNLEANSIDCIIAEPYLGKPLRGNETKQWLLNQTIELKNLYISAFKQFNKILKKSATTIFIIPRYKYHDEWIRIDCLEEIKKSGFSPIPLWQDNLSLLYSRPDQKVGREIWKFIKR